MGDPRGTSVDGDFPELEEYRRGWGVDMGIEQGNRENRPVALGDPPQFGNVRSIEDGHGNAVDLGHFIGVGDGRALGSRPSDDGRDDEARAGCVVVQASEHRGFVEPDIEFLVELAKGRLLRGFAGVDPATRESPLPGVVTEPARPPRDQEAGRARWIRGEDDPHGCGRAGLAARAAVEVGEVSGNPCPEWVIEFEAGCHGGDRVVNSPTRVSNAVFLGRCAARETSLAIGSMLHDVERRKISLGDGKTEIALLDWGGEGPVALLHHANGFCGAVWDGVVDFLRDRFRVLAVDARGHGDSSPVVDMEDFGWDRLAHDLAGVAQRVIREFGVERIALGLGHSFGGSLTALVAARHPSFYERIVLVDPVLFPPNVDPERTRGNELALRTRRRCRRWDTRDAARAYLATKPLFEDWQARALDLYVAEGLRDLESGGVGLKCAPEVEAEIFGGPHDIDLYEAAERLLTPRAHPAGDPGQLSGRSLRRLGFPDEARKPC